MPPDPEQLCRAVFHWLSTVPSPNVPAQPTDAPCPSPTAKPGPVTNQFAVFPPSRKRRASRPPSPAQPLSPPATIIASADTADAPLHMADARPSTVRTPSRSKKRKTGRDAADPDATPRARGIDPPASGRMPPSARSQSSASQSLTDQSDASSQISRRSSPTKQLDVFSVRPDGVEIRDLRRDVKGGLPPKLAEMLTVMEAIQTGVGIISKDQEAAVTLEASQNPAFPPVYPFMFAPASERDDVGQTPSVDAIEAIYSRAARAHQLRASEATWNGSVHLRVLELAVDGGAQYKSQLLEVENCTSASIIPTYLPRLSHTKKVDFVIVLDPENDTDPDTASRIDALRETLPEMSINHCYQHSLTRRPIAVSIETKRGGAAEIEAQLQVGTWGAAWWNSLEDQVSARCKMLEDASFHAALVGVGGDSDGGSVGAAGLPGAGILPLRPETGCEAGGEAATAGVPAPAPAQATVPGGRLKELPFMPAVIVQGHVWSFAATTREGQKTILWTDCAFGSTKDPLGIYRIGTATPTQPFEKQVLELFQYLLRASALT
ncbi:hypothetical protein CONLIGDRAFT_687567 [Coniochaeta ligniaria NRRL 30616]|uniref:PD-(D/E)XK nuclease-like domain-containing protein n=1 Tax=Coniochaeta ligniaria NRRL 30616 TaxID=1408157 RepID=A0A1J7I503_9PEZI|nr:hypothetical protein CONLIGDRAFT_687567 [Coniochaeta ligniaria NRRL 30616]